MIYILHTLMLISITHNEIAAAALPAASEGARPAWSALAAAGQQGSRAAVQQGSRAAGVMYSSRSISSSPSPRAPASTQIFDF